MGYTIGTSGNDTLTASGVATFGGKGDDTYQLALHNLTIIDDRSGRDTLILPFSTSEIRVAIIDSRHIFLSDSNRDGAVIIGGAAGSIETIRFTDRVVSGQELSDAINAHRSEIPNYGWSILPSSMAYGTAAYIRSFEAYDRELELQQEGKATLSAAPVAGTSSALIEHDGFNALFYLSHNQDVAASGMDAYTHYENHGKAEGRSPNAYYDEKYYFDHNPDVAAAKAAGAITSGYDHFILHGLAEGRAASSNYTEMFYLHNNPDVAAAVQHGAFHSGYEHYVLIGSTESRVADHYIA